MAHQFQTLLFDRSCNRHSSGIVSLSPSHQLQNWRSQQSLLMGSNTPTYHRQTSVSPQASHFTSNFGMASPSFQTQPMITSSPSSGQVMYMSSTPYNYGNPGFYYDSMQFPVSHDTQTSPYSCAPAQNTFVPIYNHSPTTSAHVTSGDTPLHQNFESTPTDNCTTIPCGDDLSIHDYRAYSQDMPLEDGSPSQLPYNQHNQGIDPDLLYNGSQQVNHDIGCQASSS
jgi:hypothetical protein